MRSHQWRLQGLGYEETLGDEVEDLFALLAFVKQRLPDVQAVASGAIASDYQRLRVEHVCAGLTAEVVSCLHGCSHDVFVDSKHIAMSCGGLGYVQEQNVTSSDAEASLA